MPYTPAPGYTPVFKPALPYHHLLPGGLQPGTSVYVQGVVSQCAKRFSVDFAGGQDGGVNIPVHFNPRFDGNDKIVLNTFQDGKWDTEEHQQMPFHKGKHFEIIFTVRDEEYQILVNTNPVFSYKHKMPPQSVKVVTIGGDLELQSLAVIEEPKKEKMLVMRDCGEGIPEHHLMLWAPAIFHPSMPFKNNIPGGLKPKMTFVIRGSVPNNAGGFAINFVAGPDIALHINPRLNQRSVVRNSFLRGSWGDEETDVPYNPFEYGHYFELSIRCGQYRFIVYANNEYFFSYTHRYIHFPQINTLTIGGDVNISYVQY
ncbi:galectin-6-like [Erythrolamprus reginae]|uniref:galectin-6-like n=1 Tax=Erythrolamprus reginae TaxID=121349 RepID=UPI00396C8982